MGRQINQASTQTQYLINSRRARTSAWLSWIKSPYSDIALAATHFVPVAREIISIFFANEDSPAAQWEMEALKEPDSPQTESFSSFLSADLFGSVLNTATTAAKLVHSLGPGRMVGRRESKASKKSKTIFTMESGEEKDSLSVITVTRGEIDSVQGRITTRKYFLDEEIILP